VNVVPPAEFLGAMFVLAMLDLWLVGRVIRLRLRLIHERADRRRERDGEHAAMRASQDFWNHVSGCRACWPTSNARPCPVGVILFQTWTQTSEAAAKARALTAGVS
jgi:hypothetical protein